MRNSLIILLMSFCTIYGQDNSPYAIVVEDTVEFRMPGLIRNCGAYFIMEAELDNYVFTITGIDSGDMATCGSCTYDVDMIVGGIENGEYTALYYTYDVCGYDESTWETVRDTTFIGETQFSVNSSEVSPYQILTSYQSPCYNGMAIDDDQHPESSLVINSFPNPFNGSTRIDFYLASDELVRISVYDISGRLIENIVNEKYSSGYHDIRWQANVVSSGMYFLAIFTPSEMQSRKLILIK